MKMRYKLLTTILTANLLCYTVEATPEEDFQQYKAKAEQGDSIAQCRVGYCYRVGEGVTKNYAEAMKWFLKAAEQGNPNGQQLVADLFDLGLGVEKNAAEALKWHLKAAFQGYYLEPKIVAARYYSGTGVEKNLVEAYAWYSVQAASSQQDPMNIFNPEKYPSAADMREKLEKSMTKQEVAVAQQRAIELSEQIRK